MSDSFATRDTLSVNGNAYTIYSLAKLGQRVLLVDADPQASALAWSRAREVAPLFPWWAWSAPRCIGTCRIVRGAMRPS